MEAEEGKEAEAKEPESPVSPSSVPSPAVAAEPPAATSEAAAEAKEAEWCMTRMGPGVVERREEGGRVYVRLASQFLLCTFEDKVRVRPSLRVRSFAKGLDSAEVPDMLGRPLSDVVVEVAKRFSVAPGDVRLVHNGRELPREWGSRVLGTCCIQPSLRFLLVVDEKSCFVLDPAQCGDGIEISSDAMSACMRASNRWRSVRGTEEIVEGRVYWDLHLDRCTTGNMFVGVCTSEMGMSNFCGSDEHGYGFYGCGNAYRRGVSKKYGKQFRCGDTLRVCVDMGQRTLSFHKNGSDLGVAFENLPDRVYPVVSLYTQEDEFHLTSFGTF